MIGAVTLGRIEADLGRDPKFLAFDFTGCDRLVDGVADGLLIIVEQSGVDVPIAGFDGCPNRRNANLIVQCRCSQPHCWNSAALTLASCKSLPRRVSRPCPELKLDHSAVRL